MKKTPLILYFISLGWAVTAQQPSQKEIDKAMAEYTRTMKDPNAKKTLDSMGIKMPSSQGIMSQYDFAAKHTSQQQMNAILGVETIPARDAARIATLPKGVLSDAQLKVFVQGVRTAIGTQIGAPARQLADELVQNASKQHKGAEYLASMANGLWMSGHAEVALELMGRAVAANPADADNLNSYAVFLSALGGQQLALPILQKLNRDYPGNSTVLNNIGQAWFGLGDMTMSKKYLDSAIHFFGMHSQANYTEGVIEESKGNKQAAIDCLTKSLQNGYNPAKANRLSKLKGGLSNGDIGWNLPKPADALGLEKLVSQRPPFYFTVDASQSLFPQWAAFRQSCIQKNLEMQTEATKRALAVQNKMMKQLSSGRPGAGGSGSAGNIFIARKAREMLSIVSREEADFNQRMEDKSRKQLADLRAKFLETSAAIRKINDKYTRKRQEQDSADGNKYDKTEGDDSHSVQLLRQYNERACGEAKKLVEEYYNHYNRILDDLGHEWVSRELYYTNEIVYYSKYSILDDNEYQLAKLGAVSHFINLLGIGGDASPVDFYPGATGYMGHGLLCKTPEEQQGSMKLKDFDEVNCNSHVSMSIPGVVSSKWDCNTETDEWSIGPTSGKYKENLNTGQFTVHGELGYNTKIGSVSAGPLKAGASAGAGVFVEANNTGVTDVGATAHGEVKVGANVDIPLGQGSNGKEDSQSVGKSVTVAGAEVRVGWNSGPSLTGKGALSGISIK
ncbi:hypothetical protein Q4E93_06680 [Flavitalea sp. BT771]|uniref:tetratricopeptide repeat protein n=1 Tax=Flavitalea sp. BT771 TaxID=3063329 RepID=UPI0026E2B2B0|nr:hypothetical protein [Flavitalea sp. BT771]MDO6430261.1 hypothetical protein [Flavitalea sp. BT771]MDV6219599.1 hypothetical protein [Flavitalea sp. BT771]